MRERKRVELHCSKWSENGIVLRQADSSSNTSRRVWSRQSECRKCSRIWIELRSVWAQISTRRKSPFSVVTRSPINHKVYSKFSFRRNKLTTQNRNWNSFKSRFELLVNLSPLFPPRFRNICTTSFSYWTGMRRNFSTYLASVSSLVLASSSICTWPRFFSKTSKLRKYFSFQISKHFWDLNPNSILNTNSS